MKQGYIAVIDSGIGGISLLSDLIKNFPNEKFLYLGDNNNAPYGEKSKHELIALTMKNIDYVKSFGIKAIVFACNTISVNILLNTMEYSNLPVYGIFPPVERCLMNKEKTLLLCTRRTAENYMSVNGLDVVSLPTLAKDIEKNAFNLYYFDAIATILSCHDGDFINKKGYYDNVILGCTHYDFIKKQIFDHFCPKKIITGNEYTIKKMSEKFKMQKSLEKHYCFLPLFVGEKAEYNFSFFKKCGQSDKFSVKKIKKIAKKF